MGHLISVLHSLESLTCSDGVPMGLECIDLRRCRIRLVGVEFVDSVDVERRSQKSRPAVWPADAQADALALVLRRKLGQSSNQRASRRNLVVQIMADDTDEKTSHTGENDNCFQVVSRLRANAFVLSCYPVRHTWTWPSGSSLATIM